MNQFQPKRNEKKKKSSSNKRKSYSQRSKRRKSKYRGESDEESDSEDEDNSSDSSESSSSLSEKYIRRVSLRSAHSVLKQRKGLISLRIHSGENPVNNEKDDMSSFISRDSSSNSLYNHKDQICFEFLISTVHQDIGCNGIMKITRRIGVSDQTSSLQAVAPRQNCSDILTNPKVFMKMLNPIKRTAEVALHFDFEEKTVSASSFHHCDAVISSEGAIGASGSTSQKKRAKTATAKESSSSSSSTTPDMMMVSTNASAILLKTETSMKCDEFEDYNWRDDWDISSSQSSSQKENSRLDIPKQVNENVTLVFGIKEVKAMLQFCIQANKKKNNKDDFSLLVMIYFEYGGKPVVFETQGDGFSGELIMATLDHKLLTGFRTQKTSSGKKTKDRRSS